MRWVCISVSSGLAVILAASALGTEDAQTHMANGSEASERGAFDEAARQWAIAAELYGKTKDQQNQVEAMLRLSTAYQGVGQNKLAVETLEAALTIAKGREDRRQLVAIQNGLGTAYASLNQEDDAQAHFHESLQLAREANDPRMIAVVLNNLGSFLSDQQKYKEALAALDESTRLARASTNQMLVARSLVNSAFTAARAGMNAEAEKLNESALLEIGKLSTSHNQSFLFTTAGQTYWRLMQSEPDRGVRLFPPAEQAYQNALATADKIHDARATSYALGYLGQLYEFANRPEEALSLTHQAAFRAQEAQANDSLFRWQWQSGRLLKARGELEPAIVAYRRAMETLQTVRLDLVTGCCGARSSFRETIGPVFFELADALLQRADSMQPGEDQQNLLREACRTVERLKSVELEDYFQDECVSLLRAKTTSVAAVDAKTAVVYFIPLADRTELLVSYRTGMERFKAPVGKDRLTEVVREFRRNLEKRTSHEYRLQGQQLYDWLIRPLRPSLAERQIKTLVFVPDGALRTIPLAALRDGDEFLVQNFAVAVTPGLMLMEPKPIRRESVNLLLNGVSEPVQGFAALDFVPRELESVQSLYRSQKLLNRSFLIPVLEKKMTEEQFTIIHIASHGQFERDARKTFVLSYDGKLTLNMLEQLIRPSQFHGRPVELLTLSACESAAGDDRAALGLAGVAIKAGARSALATLWCANDESTSVLIPEFYAQLRDNPTISKADALQKAQLALIADPRFRHPCYWAPFLIIGNWL